MSGGGFYLWIKAVHVVAVISWLAGLLYLPRLFVYHCGAEPGSVQSETFKVMERRLLRAIINPAINSINFLMFAVISKVSRTFRFELLKMAGKDKKVMTRLTFF